MLECRAQWLRVFVPPAVLLPPAARPRFPERRPIPIEVTYPDSERRIHQALQAYSESRCRQARNRTPETASTFVTILLKKRLVSSPTAFYETLQRHMRTLHRSHAAATITEAQPRAEFTSVPPSAA